MLRQEDIVNDILRIVAIPSFYRQRGRRCQMPDRVQSDC